MEKYIEGVEEKEAFTFVDVIFRLIVTELNLVGSSFANENKERRNRFLIR